MDDSELTSREPPSDQPKKRRFFSLPSTGLGWWCIAWTAAFLVLVAVTEVMGDYPVSNSTACAAGLCALPGFILALIALIGGVDRSWLVWLALLPGLLVLSLFIFIVIALNNVTPSPNGMW